MFPYEVIAKKRDGFSLTQEEINFMVSGFTSEKIPEYQMSAFLMAMYLKGLDKKEIIYLTESMINSGKIMNWAYLKKPSIDKHSTGGVGDKTSIILAPLAACGDIIVPMASGRALGHTGGTLDKLESIPGFNTQLSTEQFTKQLEKLGTAMIGQTPELAPADGKMYALRDVTGTVESIPLTSASIMSKKLAEGIDGLVLDVKVGTGAFMKSLKDAEELALSMIDIGEGMGKRVIALMTDMNQPLGYAAGNILEIKECIEILKGKGPKDTKELTLILTGYMFYLGKKAKNPEEGKKLAEKLLKNGSAYKKFIEMVKMQGGDTSYIENPEKFPEANIKENILSLKSGYISKINTQELGICCNLLGAGRITLATPIDPTAGIISLHRIGDKIEKGEPLITIHTNKEPQDIIPRIQNAFTISKTKPKPLPLIYKVYGSK
jgi:pyrimidine-nucleoside phosphorylase